MVGYLINRHSSYKTVRKERSQFTNRNTMQYQQRKYLQLRACSFWPFDLLLQPYKLWVSLLARVFYLSEMPLSFCCSSLLPAQLLNIRYLHFATDSCRLVRVIWFLIEPINKTRVSFLYTRRTLFVYLAKFYKLLVNILDKEKLPLL